MEKFMKPEYLDKFQMYCLMKDGTIVESYDDLIARSEELKPYISSFTIEMETKPVEQPSKGVKYSLPYAERWAIITSLKNCIYKRRKSYVETFCSSLFYTQARCAEILQAIETAAHFSGNSTVLGSNPLIGILGLNDYPNKKWTSLVTTKFTKHVQYVPWNFIEGSFADKYIDINMYHPYVWYLLEQKNYIMLKQFVLDWTYIKHLK